MKKKDNIGVFIDLQGTLGGESLGDISNFKFYDNAKKALLKFNENNINIFIVTNQSHIAKAVITLEEYKEGELKLLEELDESGINIKEIYYCPHRQSDNCTCRKPSLFFANIAKEKYSLDLTQSYFIGDILRSDMKLAENAGGIGILVQTGQGKISKDKYNSLAIDERYPRINILENIEDAANWILIDIEKGAVK
jgi:D-glycero-D-manno-heptose 1,7-bisphosphate phosphatase